MTQKNITVSMILLSIILIGVVSAVLYWKEAPKPTATQETPFFTKKDDESVNQEAKQKTASVTTKVNEHTNLYTSTQFDYSFEYPQSWFITEPFGSVVQPEIVLISKRALIEGTEPDTELSITVNHSSLEDNMRNNIISREDVVFAGNPATKIYFQGDFGPAIISVLIPKNNYTFVISYDPTDEDYSTIESILNSFTFAK